MRKFEADVVISGVGQSAIGRHLGRTSLDLTIDAILAAVADAGLTLDDVSGLAAYPGGASSIGPAFAGPSLAEVYDALGLEVDYLMGNYEGPAQLGPVFNGALAISAGLARHVVVYRTVTEGSARHEARAGIGPRPAGQAAWITPFGDGPAPIGYALLARRHFHQYGTTREQLAQIALTARRHARLNPLAVMREPLELADYLSARIVSDPLSLYDCDVHCDGSTAIVLSTAAYAADAPRPAVRVEAMGVAPPARGQYAQHTALHPGWRAARQLWGRTELRPADVDVAGLYDGFSILTLLWLEALGFCAVGQGGAFVEGGKRIGLGGELPLNTNGGQLSGGRLHGLGFVHEICLQLRGEAGQRQVDGARVGVVAVGALPYVGCMLLRAGTS
ncbi:MAG TPA: thiolase family protein [Trebonia sp.]|nr:thiolase family protein [Trebonia sp.]